MISKEELLKRGVGKGKSPRNTLNCQTQREGLDFLYNLRKDMPPGNSLDLGVLFGCSMVYLAAAQESHWIYGVTDCGESTIDEIETCIKIWAPELLVFMRLYETSSEDMSPQLAERLCPLQLIYHDGCHGYGCVASDIMKFGSLLEVGGVIVFHDFEREVKDAAEATIPKLPGEWTAPEQINLTAEYQGEDQIASVTYPMGMSKRLK